MKEFNGITNIWTYNDVPEKDEFVLIANGPYQDNATEEGRSKDKKALIKKGKNMRSHMYSSLRIYNDQKRIVWDAFLPTTINQDEENYDPKYIKRVKKDKKAF